MKTYVQTSAGVPHSLIAFPGLRRGFLGIAWCCAFLCVMFALSAVLQKIDSKEETNRRYGNVVNSVAWPFTTMPGPHHRF